MLEPITGGRLIFTKLISMRYLSVLLVLIEGASIAQSPYYLKNQGGSSFDGGNGLTIGPNNEHFFTGTYTGTADMDLASGAGGLTSVGGKDAYFAKFTDNGAIVWAKSVGGTGDDEGIALVPTSGGGLYVTGTYTYLADMDPGPGTVNVGVAGLNPSSIGTFFARYTASGDLTWANSLSGINASCHVKDMTQDAAGNLYLTGWYTGPVDFDPSGNNLIIPYLGGNADAFVAKYDGNGEMLWALQIGGTASTWSNTIAVSNSGEVLVGGFHMSGTCDLDPGVGQVEHTTGTGIRSGWAVKLNTDGQYIWSADIAGDDYCVIEAVLFDAAGSAYVGGSFEGTYDLDPGPAMNPISSIGNFEDAFLVKLDGATGALVRSVPYQGTGDDALSLMTLSNDGTIYTSGAFWNDTDMDPGPGVVQPLGLLPVYFCHYDSDLNYLDHFGWYGFGNIFQTDMAVDMSGRMVSTGRFDGSYDFTDGFASHPLTAVGSFDAYIVSMGDINVGIDAQSGPYEPPSPNPSQGIFRLSLPHPSMQLSVIDASGREVYRALGSENAVIDLSRCPAGIYLVRAWDERTSVSHQVIVE